MASSDFVQNGPTAANFLPPSMPPQHGFYSLQPPFRALNPMPPMPYFRQQTPASTSATPTTPSSSSTTISLNRSQRCGICDGCKRKACGQCNYCMDSPQFGGPGVKKQSCIERRCLRVLENRLQRDTPGFKARSGCKTCEDCRVADCQSCLVCMDKKFFNNRYMPGALCAKKRCNNATNLETIDRLQPIKRPCEWAIDYNVPTKKLSLETQPVVFHSLSVAPQFPTFINKMPEPASHVVPSMMHHPPTSLLMPVPTAPPMNEPYRHELIHRPVDVVAPLKYNEPSHPICPTNELYTFSLATASDLPFPDTFSSDSLSSSEIIATQNVEEKLDNEEDFKAMNNFDDPFQPPSYILKNSVILQQL
ncbi:hypothetical protein M3Y97_00805300 [Aphelenchoides bicaudatus]|nr:hypothetical protein M3Y97_00805300 [Aphelenchoides bicaudatus]